MRYNFKRIEPKWQERWEESKIFEAQDNSDNLTIPNFLQALGFIPPAGMSVEEIIIQQDNQSQAQKTLENSGFEVKEINPNYKTVRYQRKDPKKSHSFSDNYVVPEVAAAELAEFPKHIQANGQIPEGQPTPTVFLLFLISLSIIFYSFPFNLFCKA